MLVDSVFRRVVPAGDCMGLRSAFAALFGEMPGESTIVEGASC